jgi:hypothetical protein
MFNAIWGLKRVVQNREKEWWLLIEACTPRRGMMAMFSGHLVSSLGVLSGHFWHRIEDEAVWTI